MKNFNILGVYGKIRLFPQKANILLAREDCIKEEGG